MNPSKFSLIDDGACVVMNEIINDIKRVAAYAVQINDMKKMAAYAVQNVKDKYTEMNYKVKE